MALSCHAPAAKAWLATRSPAVELCLAGLPLVETYSSGEGRGFGLFAKQSMKEHSLILSEPALILMRPSDDLPHLWKQFQQLQDEQQQRYMSLSVAENPDRDAILADKLRQRNVHLEEGEDALIRMTRVAGIMQTNAFNVDMHDGQGSNHRALFPLLARANHSCAPNAHVCFYPSRSANADGKNRMVVHALRDIEAGEEILISYFDILLPRKDRQARTKKWGFECHCPVCDEDSSRADGVSLEEQRNYLRDWLAMQTQAVQTSRITSQQLHEAVVIGSTLLENAKINASLIPAFPKMFDGLANLERRLGAYGDVKQHHRAQLRALVESAIWEARITGAGSVATTKRLATLNKLADEIGWKVPANLLHAEFSSDTV